MLKYRTITFGCQANQSNGERISAFLKKKKYKQTSKINGADLIVVNMCSVRQSAVDRVFGLSQKLAKLKNKNKKLKTVLTGCILKSDKNKFRKMFDEIWENKNYFHILPECKKNSVGYLPISNGCNNFCSYCVVPFTRGALICRNHREILNEIKSFAKKKIKEIWLLGQNINDYQSPADSSIDFPELLKFANNIPGNFKIRFMSPNPKNFSDKLIDVMANSKKIAKFLNLPVQSGDNKILKKMNRPYTIKQYKKLVEKIREKIPGINLSTDVIVGFPGETKKQFENTAKLFRELKFDIAYISRYSPRPGTAAFKLTDNVTPAEKKRRWKILNDIICAKKSS